MAIEVIRPRLDSSFFPLPRFELSLRERELEELQLASGNIVSTPSFALAPDSTSALAPVNQSPTIETAALEFLESTREQFETLSFEILSQTEYDPVIFQEFAIREFQRRTERLVVLGSLYVDVYV